MAKYQMMLRMSPNTSIQSLVFSLMEGDKDALCLRLGSPEVNPEMTVNVIERQ